MLTDTECRTALCTEGKSRVRLTDGGGLYLEVTPNRSKRWFWKYLFQGKEKRLAIGAYPEVSLRAARSARDEARKQQRGGTDPVQQRRLDKLTRSISSDDTFEGVAREFHGVKSAGWSEHYAKRWLERLQKDVFPWLGSLPLDQITAPLLLQTLRRVEARGVRELAHSLLEACGQTLRYGVATGRCQRNPAADLRGALRPVLTKHMAAVLEPDQVGDLMRAIHGYAGQEHRPSRPFGFDPSRQQPPLRRRPARYACHVPPRRVGGAGLLVPSILSRRSCGQGLRVRRTLAACGRL